MADRQLTHYEIKNLSNKHRVIVVCDNIITPENVGMIFRQCEAMAVEKLILGGQTPDPTSEKALRAARSTIKKVNYECVVSLPACLAELKSDGYRVVGLEITNNSLPVQSTSFEAGSKIVLVIGSESYGISKDVLEVIEQNVHIPMYGVNSSMNVVQALAIALYEITNQLSALKE
jgi:tRNA G18 (ribose-2'-O)-methylase SpoU